MKVMNKPKQNNRTFVPGCPLKPGAELLRWLQEVGEKENPRTRLLIPVTVGFTDEYRFGLANAYIGLGEEPRDVDEVRLHLDDGGLSIGLLDTVRGKCPEKQQTCTLWLEGYWGLLVDDGDPLLQPDNPNEHPFAVLVVHDQTPGIEAAVYIEGPRF